MCIKCLFKSKCNKLWAQASTGIENATKTSKGTKPIQQNTKCSKVNIRMILDRWKYRNKLIFIEKGVLEVVETKFNEETYDIEEEKKDFKMKDIKAMSLIVQCVSGKQLELIKNKEHAHYMWITLQDTYENKGLPGQLYLAIF